MQWNRRYSHVQISATNSVVGTFRYQNFLSTTREHHYAKQIVAHTSDRKKTVPKTMTYEETSIKIFIINSMAKSYCLIYPYLIDEPRNALSLFIFGTLHLPGHVQCCFRKYTSMPASGPEEKWDECQLL